MSAGHVGLDLVTVVGPIALATLGFATIYRTSGHMHFAYGGIWTLGTYLLGHLLESGWGMVPAVVVTLVLSSALALVSYALYTRLTVWTVIKSGNSDEVSLADVKVG